MLPRACCWWCATRRPRHRPSRARPPTRGPTTASAPTQTPAKPLRPAAAQARHWLVAQAAERLGVPVDQLHVRAGVVQVTADPSRQLAYGALLAGAHNTLELMDATPTKAAADYTVVGQSVPRVDIPAKVSGELVFVHDMRVPGMLHGRVVRPPYAGADHGDFIGNTLESVDQQSIAHIPGIRAVVVIRDFVGIVAEREEQAEQALRDLKVHWKDWPGFPRQDSPEAIAQAIRANPATQRRLVDEGDVDAAMAAADQPMPRTYVWPYQMHGSIGPSCAVAEWRSDDSTGRPRMTVCAGTQNPHVLRADLARLVGLPDVDIALIRMEAAGCYGRNGADDVAADAALLSRAVGAPVRVQLTREQEHLWEPKGTAQLMQVRGGLKADGTVAAYDFETSYPSNGAPTLALLLTDPRAAELVQATAEKAGWIRRTGPQQRPLDGDWVQGQGFAYARYIHSKWPGFGAARAAWVADVEVNKKTGEVHVRRVVVGHDAGLMVNPAGVEQQVHGNVLQTTSRALKEQVTFEPVKQAVDNREWGSYPILSFREVPVIEVMHMPRQDEAPLGSGESSSVPGTAAIANAIFDATGVRFRAPPFTPEVVRAGLNPLPGGAGEAAAGSTPPTEQAEVLPTLELPAPTVPASATWPTKRSPWARALALAAGGIAMGAALLGWRPSIAPVVQTAGASVYNAATIERGRLLAAAGDCVVCHTAPGGTPNTGGRAMETPFGKVYTTNLTPDAETGVRAEVPKTELAFPFSVRPLMAGWNALFHDATPFQPDPTRPPEWNRGAYLVQGVGHCGACHTPRNALGAELGGAAFLSGTMVDGWEAPALTGLSKAPVPWTADALYGYLRHGHSPQHGSASGPMAPVVRELAHLPDDDIRAMAGYLASLTATEAVTQPATLPVSDPQQRAQTAVAQAAALAPQPGQAQRLFDRACAACHHDGDGPRLLGVNVPLALNSNLHSDRPDNLLQVIVHGIREPAARDIGFMPGFGHALSDAQITELAGYMRQRYAPGRPAWRDVPEALARVRAGPAHP